MNAADPPPPAGAPTPLTDLFALAVRAVPSCTGIRLEVGRAGTATTVSIPERPVGEVRSSVSVRLRAPAGHVARLVLLSSSPGALTEVGREMLALLGLPEEDVRYDDDLTSDDLTDPWSDASAVDQAVGALLADGLVRSDALAQLETQSRRTGTDVAGAARELLAGLPAPDSRDASGADGTCPLP